MVASRFRPRRTTFTAWDEYGKSSVELFRLRTDNCCLLSHLHRLKPVTHQLGALVALAPGHQSTSSRTAQLTKTADVKPGQRKWSSRRSCGRSAETLRKTADLILSTGLTTCALLWLSLIHI